MVFQSEDWDAAFRRALEIGHGLEVRYGNIDAERVEWQLKEILTLDQIGDELTDGAEDYPTASGSGWEPRGRASRRIRARECSGPGQSSRIIGSPPALMK